MSNLASTTVTPSKPPSPPPAYTPLPDESTSTSYPQPPLQVQTYLPPPLPQAHPHAPFGPTPTTALIPGPGVLPRVYSYTDPRSAYALAQADRRARWRWVGAFVWAVAICFAWGVFVSSVIIDRQGDW